MRLNNHYINVVINGNKYCCVKTLAFSDLARISPYNTYKTLYECYGNPSFYKQNAYNDCRDLAWALEDRKNVVLYGHGICGYNSMQFTYYIDFALFGHVFSIKRTANNDYIIGRESDIKWLLEYTKDNKSIVL